MRDEEGDFPLRASEGWILARVWGPDRPTIATLRLQELDGGRLHISITTDSGDVLDYIFHGHYLIKWAKEGNDE